MSEQKLSFSSLFFLKHPLIRIPIAISLGAILGALIRYYIILNLNQWLQYNFPFGTFFINISGAFLMGFIAHLHFKMDIISPDFRYMFIVGFLGSYTTFSTYELEIKILLEKGKLLQTSFYWLGSMIFGVIFFELGNFLGKKFRKKSP
ncbi:fluoride efflux transporter CrcB [Geminocystis sp. NIES-3709]|uniref:fluoride efflux transporter CrcB n=1 Tax=Geminocystis sp. NIES-3709 TaxID=1617448 RepID=UPI0005FC6427|nr:fluoride efflux transporter CrcB [Geminocystis sp. NIES-3709]BAQ64892.1 CrcB protein [Geminocystis sp. NIES-3709]